MRRQPPLATPSTCAARAWRSTRPARRRWSRCTWPARASGAASATLALAGGVNVHAHARVHHRRVARAACCRRTAAARRSTPRANGYVRGEGAGVVVLKPLSAALRRRRPDLRRDPRHRRQPGRAHQRHHRARAGAAQEALLREAYARRPASRPATVQYVEAHGTGTPVGDPIEASALGAVLAIGRPPDEPLRHRLGQDEHRPPRGGRRHRRPDQGRAVPASTAQIPPNLHFETPNPAIPFDALQLRVPTSARALAGRRRAGAGRRQLVRLRRHQRARRAGGGRRRPRPTRAGADGGARAPATLLPLSARSPEALRALAARLRASCARPAREDAARAARPRATPPARAAATTSTGWPSSARLARRAGRAAATPSRPARPRPACRPGGRRRRRRRLAFVFTGMGPQWWAMGRELLRAGAGLPRRGRALRRRAPARSPAGRCSTS